MQVLPTHCVGVALMQHHFVSFSHCIWQFWFLVEKCLIEERHFPRNALFFFFSPLLFACWCTELLAAAPCLCNRVTPFTTTLILLDQMANCHSTKRPKLLSCIYLLPFSVTSETITTGGKCGYTNYTASLSTNRLSSAQEVEIVPSYTIINSGSENTLNIQWNVTTRTIAVTTYSWLSKLSIFNCIFLLGNSKTKA